MKLLYFMVDFCTIIIPLIFSFHPKLKFYKNFKAFFTSNLIVAGIFIAWDIFFTKLGVWGFNPNYISGLYFFNLPVEEVLFFICIPFACVFTYYSLGLFYKFREEPLWEKVFVIVVATILAIIGIVYYYKLYTSLTCISLAFTLILYKFVFRMNGLTKLVMIYPLLLLPFFVVNGILTGTGLQEPVVWYNNEQNLGMRILTIPVEDIFYGFELIALNVFLFEYFKIKYAKKNDLL